MAGPVGLAGIGLGGWAVFVSDNQAGTTTLLLVGAVLFLVAVQGTTVIKLGKDNLELGRRQRRKKALDLVERAEEKADQDDLKTAGAYQEAAKAIDPSIRSDPSVMAVDDRIYTTAAMEAVLRCVDWISRIRAERPTVSMLPNSSNSGAYLTIAYEEDQSRSVTVAIRRRLHLPNSNTTYVSILDIIKGLEGNILIVSEVGPPKLVEEKTRSVLTGRLAGTRNVEFVQWTEPDDDPVLRSKLIEWLA